MLPLLWAVYIACILCTVVVSISVVAQSKIENSVLVKKLQGIEAQTDSVVSEQQDSTNTIQNAEEEDTDELRGSNTSEERDTRQDQLSQGDSTVEKSDGPVQTDTNSIEPKRKNNPHSRREIFPPVQI
jgi:hypothetical protein